MAQNLTTKSYTAQVDENVKPQADANVDAQEDETETEDDEILRTQEPEGIEELSDYIHMESENESDPLFDHENETEDDDDYTDFVDDEGRCIRICTQTFLPSIGANHFLVVWQ
ncbi:hypothetical protein R6Q57_016490 [Mikania cordata]